MDEFTEEGMEEFCRFTKLLKVRAVGSREESTGVSMDWAGSLCDCFIHWANAQK